VSYVVTSSGRDQYSAMTRVPCASVRISNPGFRVLLITDSASAQRLAGARDPLLDEVDAHVHFETPEGDASFRNRFLKTNLRSLIDGSYLFLDSDTLIRGDLSDVFSTDADIAGAPNHSKDALEEQIWYKDRAVLTRLGWRVRPDVYINGGAMLCHDTPGARRFGTDWHAKWLTSYRQTNGYRDQPALNAAVFDSGVRLAVLPHRFNAQFKTQVSTARDAVVWHCYAGAGNPPVTEFDALVEALLRGGELRKNAVEAAIMRTHPWRRHSRSDDYLARFIELKGHFDRTDTVWYCGYRGRARLALIRRLFLPGVKERVTPSD